MMKYIYAVMACIAMVATPVWARPSSSYSSFSSHSSYSPARSSYSPSVSSSSRPAAASFMRSTTITHTTTYHALSPAPRAMSFASHPAPRPSPRPAAASFTHKPGPAPQAASFTHTTTITHKTVYPTSVARGTSYNYGYHGVTHHVVHHVYHNGYYDGYRLPIGARVGPSPYYYDGWGYTPVFLGGGLGYLMATDAFGNEHEIDCHRPFDDFELQRCVAYGYHPAMMAPRPVAYAPVPAKKPPFWCPVAKMMKMTIAACAV